MDDSNHGKAHKEDEIGIMLKIKRFFSIKNNLIVLMMAIILVFTCTIYKINEVKTRAFSVYFGNDIVGVVRNKEDAIKIVEGLQKDLADTYNMDIVMDKKLKFEDIHAKNNEITSSKKLRYNIKSKLSFCVTGYALLVDDKEIGILKTEEDAMKVLEKVKEPYEKTDKNKDSKMEEVKILEDIKIVKKEVPLAKISSVDKVVDIAKKGTDEKKTHVVEEGESYWTIAYKYNLSIEDLIEANPDMDPDKVFVGDKVNLIVPKPLITVATVEEVKYTEDLNFDVKVEENSSMYKNQKKVKVKGSKGKSEITAKVIKHNGTEVAKAVVKEDVVKEPITQVVVKGTKDIPKTVATGAFMTPTRGSMSSRFGRRHGRMHNGIDLSANPGAPITAADGGRVTYTGSRGNYGYMVEIDHENGFVTRYAHCSKIYVSTGQRVHKGQKIAAVGSTGRSTGPHLHFEVLKNGVNQNPLNYLK